MSDASAGPRVPNPVLAVFGRALETALNRLVDLDADASIRLAALDGRAVALDLRDTALSLRIAVEGGRLRVGPSFEAASALRIAATPASLLALAFARGDDDALAPGRVEVAGDAELARRLERLARDFAPDFDAAFTRAFGDVAGFQVASGVRRSLGWLRRSAHATARDATEFLSEETGDIVARAELERFLDEVDTLRERADRLAARVQRIARRRA